jgi:hypothetical protein
VGLDLSDEELPGVVAGRISDGADLLDEPYGGKHWKASRRVG